MHLESSYQEEKEIDSDVLVIGGGIAGCFAAIKAREQGVSVTLVAKSCVGKSGQSLFPSRMAIFNPEWGDNLDLWINQTAALGEYISNQEWTKIILNDSYSRYQELVSWGLEFQKEKDGGLLRSSTRGPFKLVNTYQRKIGQVLRKQVEKSEIKIIDRVMVTDFLKMDGRIIGAVGIHLYNNKFYLFVAKATVISAGSGGLKPPGYPISEITSDADAMAYRAGTEITGKEFVDTHRTSLPYPAYGEYNRRFGVLHPNLSTVSPSNKIINAEGAVIQTHLSGCVSRLGESLNMEFEANAGRAPMYLETSEGRFTVVGGASSGMSLHTAEGICPIDTKCATALPGLYAAGDCCGTVQSGARYSAGTGSVHASVTGARAGLGAAEYALQATRSALDRQEVTRLKKITLGPLERKGGFSPAWVTQVLQNIMMPYFIMYIKRGDRLQASLTLVEFIRDHLVPQLTAKDPHELRLANETKNMVLNSEMRLRASLFRTESRGFHYREDYPRRDDPNWLAWVTLKEDRGQMKLTKRPIPQKWWPDLKKPYEERYPVRFPGEQII